MAGLSENYINPVRISDEQKMCFYQMGKQRPITLEIVM